MKILLTLIFILLLNFINCFGQNSDFVVVTGFVRLSRLQTIDNTEFTFIPFDKEGKKLKKVNVNFKKKPKIKRDEIVKGAVIKFSNEKSEEFKTYTDSKGKFKILLPRGKYKIYSTVKDECFMCAEYLPNEYFQLNENKFNLDILLQFYGCG